MHLTDTVSVNKMHLTDTVSVNKMHLTDTVPVNKMNLTGTVFHAMYISSLQPLHRVGAGG